MLLYIFNSRICYFLIAYTRTRHPKLMIASGNKPQINEMKSHPTPPDYHTFRSEGKCFVKQL
jgi:hypothetical protein